VAWAKIEAPGWWAQRHLAERLVAECAITDQWRRPAEWLAAAPTSSRSFVDWTEALNRHDPDDESFRGLLSRWSDVHFKITILPIAGEYFTEEHVVTGVHTGDLPGLPATGRSFRLTGSTSAGFATGRSSV
jgi:hypothetical protein